MRKVVFLNLAQIQMPVGAVTSITHRITGVLLVFGTPFCIYLLGLSLQSPQSYTQVMELFDHAAFKLIVLVFIWALAHHLLAGVRHLLSDIDIGSDLSGARRSAWSANIGGLIVALLAAGALF